MAFCSGADVVTLYQLLNEVFATPEAQMGFHPDAGASYYLSRLPGEYLALTGEKLNGAEMIACGLATHYSLNARLASVEERLGKLIKDDPSVIEDSLAQYGDLVYPDKRSILHKIEAVDKCFSQDTVEEIIDALLNDAVEYEKGVRARLVDNDFAPKWEPSSLGEVTKDMVDYYFAPLDESEPELDLPTTLSEPSVS
ncbi:unnamed protein product [Camellia sinensis]